MIFLKKKSDFSINDLPLSVDEVGEKAIGLFSIPDHWTPPYFILTTSFFLEWDTNNSENITKSKHIADSIDSINKELFALESNGYSKVIIRSSASIESMEDRGNYESKECNNTLQEVLQTIEKVFLDSNEYLKFKETNKLAIIIQGYINPTYSGHLSNERRISKEKNFWSIESINHKTNESESETFNVIKLKNSIDISKMFCSNKTELIEKLKQIGYSTFLVGERCHYEWVWDRKRLWIVQKDTETSVKGTKPGYEFKIKNVSINFENLKVLKIHKQCASKWDKVVKSQSFEACDLPSVNLYVLEDSDTIKKLLYEEGTKDLDNDLKLLTRYPIVIRTSLKQDDNIHQHLYQPKTDTIFHWADAKQFLINTIQRLIKEHNLNVGEFSFLIHHFIVSKSCALAYTTLDADKVRIDSSWGLADGLAYNSYDSFEVDLRTNYIKKKIRGKYEYLDMNKDGKWIRKISGSDWDWKSSLTKGEVLTIASMSRKVTNYYKKPLIIMFFINYESSKLHPHILPWHHLKEIPPFSKTIPETLFTRKKIRLSIKEDFELLKKRTQKGYYKNENVTIQLKLAPSIIRDTDFIKEISSLAKDNDFHVEIEGSVLSHAFYIFSSTGVKLKCENLFEPTSEKQSFNKLVRDKIPEKISSHGESSITSKLPPRMLIELLKSKAVEEALELSNAKQTSNIIEELVDLFEIVRSLSNVINVPFLDIQKLADKKRDERGGFEEGIYLKETEGNSLTTLGSIKPENLPKANIKALKGSKAKVDDNKILFSLIPPSLKAEKSTIYIKSIKKFFIIKYLEKEIELLVDEHPQNQNPDQLELF